ncbi:inhibitor of apoptosis repeat-containing protein [Dothidotthia symphoricarpi CBS 119687]|uniref:Inhibitor of apoptosis repeat-containing protein n=1 Tax=Dothidotthia symphoricarpi CBS 119687 TaxID=1392245 RepID=A0A6A6AHU2_9PLEO|nr:inhibitor of apoptosis repeat-containing protein [Dothidotthia symphoricarpi CBS 119687]KAF2130477.1 inhibitor of apoptosis repeat-containing protein [Dothidotthia symphoricarpi CBS 119687]
MDASLTCVQARLATFQGSTGNKLRRTSSRSKKAAPKAKNAWPLAAPSAQDLAYAGFVWRPTSASPDNVQCFACHCQLDGWEESDNPAYEHLTHSPSCGYAAVICIRLRNGDPGRTEEDPTSESMTAARRDTFADLWPLDTAAGFPGPDQLAAAGWYYDPTEETSDGVTCPYCSLSLDAWDAGDDPLEEHRRRAADCLFFSLSELYHPTTKPAPKKGKRASTTKATKAKRASTRSSIASTTKKSTRGKKRTSEEVEDFPTNTVDMEHTGSTQSKKRTSEQVDGFEDVMESPKRLRYSSISSLPDSLPAGTPKKTPSGQRESFDMSSLPNSLLVSTPKRTPDSMKAGGLQQIWQPIEIDAFFKDDHHLDQLMSDVLIDAGLDTIDPSKNPEDLHAAVMAGLTDAEKDMTVEQWIIYNAHRGEAKLRMQCQQQIAAFEAETKRAMAALDKIVIV